MAGTIALKKPCADPRLSPGAGQQPIDIVHKTTIPASIAATKISVPDCPKDGRDAAPVPDSDPQAPNPRRTGRHRRIRRASMPAFAGSGNRPEQTGRMRAAAPGRSRPQRPE